MQKALLVNASRYFKIALTQGWLESKKTKLPLHEVELEVAEHFLYFLIRGEILLPAATTDNELLPVRLWVFADMIELPKLQNLAMRQLYKRMQPGLGGAKYPSTKTIAEALDRSMANSTLHKFMMSILLVGIHDGKTSKTATGSLPQLGRYTSKDLEVLERIPGLTTRLLYETQTPGKTNVRALALSELMVPEK